MTSHRLASGTSARPAPTATRHGRRRWRRPTTTPCTCMAIAPLQAWLYTLAMGALNDANVTVIRRKRRCRRSGQARNARLLRPRGNRDGVWRRSTRRVMCCCSGLTTARGPGTRGASCRRARRTNSASGCSRRGSARSGRGLSKFRSTASRGSTLVMQTSRRGRTDVRGAATRRSTIRRRSARITRPGSSTLQALDRSITRASRTNWPRWR